MAQALWMASCCQPPFYSIPRCLPSSLELCWLMATLALLFCFSWLCCNSVWSPQRVKHGLQGQLLCEQNLDASQLPVLDASQPCGPRSALSLPPTLCPRDWPSVLPQPGLALGMGWEAWERLEDGEGRVSWCFAWGLLEDEVYSQLSRFPKPSLPSCPEQAALMTSNFCSPCSGP